MSHSDPIADMLTRIRNAGRARHAQCVIPGSKLKKSILEILKKEGFIEDFENVKNGSFEDFQVKLKYGKDKSPVFREITRVSKPGKRIYIHNESIRPYKNNIGVMILSTSKGVMTGKQAKKLNVGGEYLCKVS